MANETNRNTKNNKTNKEKKAKKTDKASEQNKNNTDNKEKKVTGKNVTVNKKTIEKKPTDKASVDKKTEDNLIDPEIIKRTELEQIHKELQNNKKAKRIDAGKKLKRKEIFKNELIIIFIELYFIVLVLSNNNFSTIEFISDLKIIALIEVFMAVILFEIAYKKEDEKIGLHGIEMTALGISTMILLNLYSNQFSHLNIALAVIIGIFTLYFLIKMFVIAIKKKK